MKSTYQFEALFNNAAIGIIMVDSTGTIILMNDFAVSKFGYASQNELLDKKIEVLIPTRYKQKHETHRDNYNKANPHNRPMGMGMDLFGKRKDGSEFPVEVSLSTYETTDGKVAIAFVSDITIRKKSEDALVRLNAELEEKVKERTKSLEEALEKEKELNELKSRFVTMASHEFRTPLSTILSSVYLVSKYTQTEEQPKRDKHTQRIISSVNLLTDILNDFLSVGKIEEGKVQVRMQDVVVDELLGGYLNEMTAIIKEGQRIDYVHTGSSKAVLDPALLHHIIMNLVSNAIKFSPERTTIQISTIRDDEKLVLSVKDTGIGIAAEDQQHLFQRFFRGTNVSNIQGTGLGLHIVAKYAELMGGDISCHSEINKGTEFTITFKQNKLL